MIHLQCQLCMWEIHGSPVEMGVALYMFHCIRDHWDMMQKAHDNPEMLDRAMALVGGTFG